MSEQIEIEVGLSTARFNQAIQSIQRSLNSLSGATSNIRVDGLKTGLDQIKRSTQTNKREALTLQTAFREIGNIKVSNKSLRDIKEITREFLRIVKELGPVITLAMNALDRPLQKAVLSMTRMLTEVERANSTFLVLRKVLPIRLFNTLSVNAERVTTSIRGMAKDFVDFGNTGGKAIVATTNYLRAFVQKIQEAGSSSKQLADNLTSGGFTKAQESLRNISESADNANQSIKRLVSNTKLGRNVLGGLSTTSNGIKNSFSSVVNSGSKLGNAFRSLSRGFTNMLGRSKGLAGAFGVLGKVLGGGVYIGFRLVTGSVALLAQGFKGLLSFGIPKLFNGVKASAQLAGRAISNISSTVASIATAPIKGLSGAFSSFFNVLSGSVSSIGAIGASITSLGFLLSKVAQGSVATYRKEWIKTMSEIPGASEDTERALKADLKSLQRELGITSEEALPALQRALQIGFSSDTAIDAVRQSVSLFLADIADLQGSVEIVGNTMRAFAGANLTAEEAVDKLFVASKSGGINLQELGSAVQRVGPAIAGAGLSFDEFASATAVLARSGRTTYQSMQDLASLTESIARPTAEARELFKRLGIEFGQNAISSQNFASTLNEIFTKVGNSSSKLSTLLGTQENLNTAFNLSQENGELFAQVLERVGASGGKAKANAEDLDNAFSRTLRRVKVLANELSVQLGEIFEPAIKSLTDFIREYTDKIRQAARVGVQLFKDGNLSEVIQLSFSVGLDKALVFFQNFSTKASAGLLAGLTVAIDRFGAILPSIGSVFSDLWDFVVESFYSTLSRFIRGFGLLADSLKSLLIKGIEEAYEKFNNFFGGGFTARSIEQIFKQSFDTAGLDSLANYVKGLADEVTDTSKTTGESIVSQLVPALKDVSDAVVDGYTGVEGTAKIGEETEKNIKRLDTLLEQASSKLEKTANNLVEADKNVADAKELTKQGAKEGSMGGSGTNAQAEAIAGSLQRIGGGGNVAMDAEHLAKSQIDLLKRQLEEQRQLNSIIRAWNNIQGEVVQ